MHAGAQALQHVLGVVVHAEHEDARVGRAAAELRRGLQAGQPRHRDVEHRDVGRQLERQGQRLGAVRGLADDGEAGLGLEHVADAGADDRVVVGHQHPDGGALTAPRRRRPAPAPRAQRPAPRAPPNRTLPPSALIRSRMPARPMCPARSSRSGSRPAGPARRPAPAAAHRRLHRERDLDAAPPRRAAARSTAPPAARGTGPARPPSRATGRAAGAAKAIRMSLRAPKSATSDRSAGSSPRSSSSDGRRSLVTLRMLRMPVSISARA